MSFLRLWIAGIFGCMLAVDTARALEVPSPASRVPANPHFAVTSPAVDANGKLSAECTCDGARASPPLKWSHAPLGTESYAVVLWHVARDQEKTYWVVYNIPASVSGLPMNSREIGTTGLNDKQRSEYDPMCSKGPGVKTYHITVYALSKLLELPERATRAQLLAGIKRLVLAEATLDFQYERRANPVVSLAWGIAAGAAIAASLIGAWLFGPRRIRPPTARVS